MNSSPTKILVVDDSALYRQSIHNVLRDVSDVTIVGTAKDGVEALEKIEELDPEKIVNVEATQQEMEWPTGTDSLMPFDSLSFNRGTSP